MLRFKNLGSGSSGNATLVHAKAALPGPLSDAMLLVDCGLPLRELETRLIAAGVEPAQISAVFVTHEHSDHIGCAARFSAKHGTPVWMSAGTWEAARTPDFQGRLRTAQDGQPIDLGALRVMPFAVPHDAAEPLQLRCSTAAHTLGILTDLGHITEHVVRNLQGCDALLLECNHDPDLLRDGPYPPFLKARVAGHQGHLSNAQAAEIAVQVDHANLAHIVAAHLSAQNNRPTLAVQALSQALQRPEDEIAVATQAHGCAWITL